MMLFKPEASICPTDDDWKSLLDQYPGTAKSAKEYWQHNLFATTNGVPEAFTIFGNDHGSAFSPRIKRSNPA